MDAALGALANLVGSKEMRLAFVLGNGLRLIEGALNRGAEEEQQVKQVQRPPLSRVKPGSSTCTDLRPSSPTGGMDPRVARCRHED